MELLKSVFKKWWIVLIIGILSLVLGIFFLASPGKALEFGSTVFVVFFMLVGLIELILTIANRKNIPAWGWNLILPGLILLFGIFMLATPYLKEVTVLNLFSLVLVAESILSICNAVAYKKQGGRGWGWLLALGILSAIVSITLLTEPLLSFLVYEILIGVNCLVFGIQMIITSIVMSKVFGDLKKN